MKKKVCFSIILAMLMVSVVIVYAQVRTEGVDWSWSGGDTITAKSTDKKPHVLSLAVSVSQSGNDFCYYPDINVPASGPVIWNVKDKVSQNARIIGVSVTGCK